MPPNGTSRRTVIKAAGVSAGVAALSGLGLTRALPALAATHPGMLHTQADLDRMRARVNAGTQPWKAGWDRLVANSHSQSSWTPRPLATVIRGGTGQNYTQLYNDIHAAYQNALRWRISGNTANGNTARDILNAWSGTLREVNGNADRFLAAGIYGYQFANAAELMRGYSGFDLARFRTMMLNIFYPMNNSFLTNHNDACITNYWANWDLCNMCSILAIGILCDDQAKIDQAINYFKTGAGNGSIMNAVPFLHSGGLAQWQESGRDQGHTMLGVGLMGTFCEMAWNQGQDLYGYSGNRFMQACEYIARYNLGQSVPFTTYRWGSGQNCAQQTQTAISSNSRGQDRPVWALVHGHYAGRRGLSVPNITAYMNRVRPEGGGGDYGTASGGFDQLGFGTLAFTQTPGTSTPPTAINRLQSYNLTDRYVRHIDYDVRIDPNVSPAEDAQWRLVPGLANSASGYISFESANFPGHYLRHADYDFSLAQNDGSSTFNADATFRRVAGLADSSAASFQSYNFTDRYIRHYDYVLRLDPISTDTERADATFRITS
jgi:Alpha-L-arabinofuranosidase B (ABFB) domain/Alginate lyase